MTVQETMRRYFDRVIAKSNENIIFLKFEKKVYCNIRLCCCMKVINFTMYTM